MFTNEEEERLINLNKNEQLDEKPLLIKNKNGFSFKEKILPILILLIITSIVILLVVFSIPYESSSTSYNSSPFVIVDDDSLLQYAIESRDYILSVHNSTISKLDFMILLQNDDGSWSTANSNGDQLWNATECFYLPLLASGVNWCIQNNKDPHCLQMVAGPMMNSFSSITAGIMFDIITNSPNQPFPQGPNSTAFQSWANKREYIDEFLDSLNLLGTQSLVNKVYPSNSGPVPTFGEGILYNITGPNLMDPSNSAMLMLYIVHSGILSEGTSYMTDLISRQTFSQYTSLGFVLPPGSIIHSVLGTSETDVNEIAHMILPNGKEIIISAFSDGYQNFGYTPYQSSVLGMFTENLIQNLGLNDGNPPIIVITATNPPASSVATVNVNGPWHVGKSIQAYNGTYYYINGTGYDYDYSSSSSVSSDSASLPVYTVEYTININITGLYEICVWFPADTDHSTVKYTISPNDQEAYGQGDGYSPCYDYYISQVHYGARWILLDSFYFLQGDQPTITISSLEVGKEYIVAADTVKLTLWPNVNNIPGFSNNFIIEQDEGSS